MTELFLDATPRTGKGKSYVRKLRRDGVVPAVIYGLKDAEHIQVDGHQAKLLVNRLHGNERMISLKFSEDGKETKNVLLKEVQSTPVGSRLLHIDFQEIDTSKKVHVTVEVHPTGNSVGVKLGGILQAVKHDLVVECLPFAIPEFLEADVTAMDIGHSLHVKDLILPEGITAITDPEETLIVISAPRVEEVLDAEEDLAGVEGEEESEGKEAASDGEKDAEKD